MFQTFISRHNSNFFSDKLVLTSVTPASSAPVLQTPKATSSTLYFDSLTVNAGNGGFLHCIQMDTSVNAANQVVSVGADIAFDADPKFFACLVRFESSSVPTTLPTAYDVYPLDGRHDGGYYTVKDCVTIDVLDGRHDGGYYTVKDCVTIDVLRSEERRVGKECRLWRSGELEKEENSKVGHVNNFKCE